MPHAPIIQTIDDAELAGWNYLRRRTRYRKLSEIVPRLRCGKCGKPPLLVKLCTSGASNYAPGPPDLVLPLPFTVSSIPLPQER